MIDEEVFADIFGFPRYAVSSHGRIYNKVFEKFMSPSRRAPDGQLKISLIDENEIRHSLSVAYLVAEAFVERPNYLCTEVIVLDGNYHNMMANNLAWRGPRTAYLYARQMKFEPRKIYINLPVRNCNTGVEYENIVRAGITEGLIWDEIWESTYKGTPVPPFGYTYEIIR